MEWKNVNKKESPHIFLNFKANIILLISVIITAIDLFINLSGRQGCALRKERG